MKKYSFRSMIVCLLSVLMFVMPFGAVNIFAEGETQYNLYIGGVRVTDVNKDDILEDGTVSYNPEDKVLTLENADITQGASTSASSNVYRKGIYTTIDDVTINLVGENKVSASALEYYSSRNARGISSEGKLTITGEGTLDVEILNNDPSSGVRDRNAGGIYAGSLDIDNTKISITNIGGTEYDDGDDSAAGIRILDVLNITDSDVDIKMVAGKDSTATGIYCNGKDDNNTGSVNIKGSSDVDIVIENETGDAGKVLTGISGRYMNSTPMYNRRIPTVNINGTSQVDIDTTSAKSTYANGGIYGWTTTNDTAELNIKAGPSRGGGNPSYGIGPWTYPATAGGTSGSQYLVGLKAKGDSVVELEGKD